MYARAILSSIDRLSPSRNMLKTCVRIPSQSFFRVGIIECGVQEK
jgi:hypothetical protein